MARHMLKEPVLGQPVVLCSTHVVLPDGSSERHPQQFCRIVELLGSSVQMYHKGPVIHTRVRIATPSGSLYTTGISHLRTMTEVDLETLKALELEHKGPLYDHLWKPSSEAS